MDKTINIDLGGQIFRVDNDAYKVLKRYIDHVTIKFGVEPGAGETLFDIESRIAEIFGGGQDPPVLISLEMVNKMIDIMGAPDGYYDDPVYSEENRDRNEFSENRKEMYDPNTVSATTGRALSSFFKSVGKFFSAIFRFIAILIGFSLTLAGVVSISSIIAIVLFSDSGFISQEINNIPGMLEIVLGGDDVLQYFILGGLVIGLPLLALVYLGLKIMFRTDYMPKGLSMALFIIWLVAVCIFGLGLGSRIAALRSSGKSVEYIEFNIPPDTLYIKTERRVSTDKRTIPSIDNFMLWKEEYSGEISGNARLEIGSTEGEPRITISKRARSFKYYDAVEKAESIVYGSALQGDTLQIDEYFSLPGAARWNGSEVVVSVRLPEETIVKPVEGTGFSILTINNHKKRALCFKVTDYGITALTE